mmetsp:Transcript_1643/g.10119  ORF Transcript_1643/g.10119 Transcript_1643/m.10119 type:complete len:92 (+) Transcript_1643:831-1106(+)
MLLILFNSPIGNHCSIRTSEQVPVRLHPAHQSAREVSRNEAQNLLYAILVTAQKQNRNGAGAGLSTVVLSWVKIDASRFDAADFSRRFASS